MFTIREPELSLKLNKFLHSIIIDKPKLIIKTIKGEKMLVGDFAISIIQKKLNENSLGHIPIIIRHEGKITCCRCHFEYNQLYLFNKKEFVNRFGSISKKTS